MIDAPLVTIPVVVALVATTRQAVGLPTRLLPACAIAFGVVLSLLAVGWTGEAALQGLVVGLSASGLYAGGKTLVRG